MIKDNYYCYSAVEDLNYVLFVEQLRETLYVTK